MLRPGRRYRTLKEPLAFGPVRTNNVDVQIRSLSVGKVNLLSSFKIANPGLPGADKNLLLNYFNLRDQPFGVTPDPHYLFLTKTHREALDGLLYGIRSGLGFIALTAEPGMGKTTLLRLALDRLGDRARTVFLFQSISNPTELFRALLMDLGEKDPPGTLLDLEMQLNQILLRHNERGQRVVVVLDEAQNLDDSVLEAIRMLSNFETSSHKLLQVILCGQHQLAERLATPELVQLRQRISIFATLKPLTRSETAAYIEHRLKVAGYESATPLFTPDAVSLIAHYGDGIPRNINNFCFNSLSVACASGKKVIDAEVVREVIADLGLEGSKFADPSDNLDWEGDKFAKPIDNLDWEEEAFAEPAKVPAPAPASFIAPAAAPLSRGPGFPEPKNNLHSQSASFAEPVGVPLPRGPKFPEAPNNLPSRSASFAEPAYAPVSQSASVAEPDGATLPREARFAELAEAPGSPAPTFTEPAEDAEELDWRGARIAKPSRDSDRDEDASDLSDRSAQRQISPALRVTLIATALCATVLAVIGWNVVRSGGPLMSQVSSWFHTSAPANNPPQAQAPAAPPTPAASQSTQTRRRRHEPAAQAPSSPQDDAPQPKDERYSENPQPSGLPVPSGGVTVVGARQGQSIASICVERFNGCTPDLLNTIVELNPDIKDQDHLEAGQRVFLPVIRSLPQ
jgi:general secretion pathway protein A